MSKVHLNTSYCKNKQLKCTLSITFMNYRSIFSNVLYEKSYVAMLQNT